MRIPEIHFSPARQDKPMLEIIDLSSLSARRDTLDHDPANAHRVDFFQLIHFEQGGSSHMIDFVDYDCPDGALVFVNKGQVHAFDFTRQTTGKILLFTQAFLEDTLNNTRLSFYSPGHLLASHQPVLIADPELYQSVSVLLAEIAREQAGHADQEITILLFASLMLKLGRARPDSLIQRLGNRQRQNFYLFMELLERDFHESRDANTYADHIGITYKTLNQICKQASGQTAKQLIDAWVILEIKRRLIAEQATSQQLAYEFGFDDPSNFIKYFRKHVQITPARFQKQYDPVQQNH